jgi:hypothetical protein
VITAEAPRAGPGGHYSPSGRLLFDGRHPDANGNAAMRIVQSTTAEPVPPLVGQPRTSWAVWVERKTSTQLIRAPGAPG